jgi:hypothetical protein
MNYRAPKYCPKCSTNVDVIPIIYGKPTPQGFQNRAEGKVKLGGCVFTAASPKWFCKKDNTSFN